MFLLILCGFEMKKFGDTKESGGVVCKYFGGFGLVYFEEKEIFSILSS